MISATTASVRHLQRKEQQTVQELEEPGTFRTSKKKKRKIQ